MPLTENGTDCVYGLQRLWRTSGGVAQVCRNDCLDSAERLVYLAGSEMGSVGHGEWGRPIIIAPGLNPSTGHK
jgi:hypothetical protein